MNGRMFVGSIIIWFISICYLLKSTEAVVSISPKQAFVFIGDMVRLNCTNISSHPMSWKHRLVGVDLPQYLYDEDIGMAPFYHKKGRYKIEKTKEGRCDLVILNISPQDAGNYICSGHTGDEDNGELIVLDTNPICDSNLSHTHVLVDNDCGLEPDYMELRCSIAYHGNVPPVLELHHSNPDFIATAKVHRISTANTSTVFQTLKASIDFNGTNFACTVKEAGSYRTSTGCMKRDLSVKYFYSRLTSYDVTSFGDNIINVSCVANTSEHCVYRWQATEKRTNTRVEIHGQRIFLIPQYFDIYNNVGCLAECRVQGKLCSAQVMEIKLIDGGVKVHETDDNLLYKILLPLLLIVIAALTVVLCFRKYFQKVLQRIRRLLNPAENTFQYMEIIADPKTNIFKLYKSLLVENLDTVNGLADCLLSKGVLTYEQKSEITDPHHSYGEQNNTLLFYMLIHNEDYESTCKAFLDALLETDQKHIHNFIIQTEENISDQMERILSDEEKQLIDQNWHKLKSQLDVNKNSFLEYLLANCCITERHKESIDAEITKSNKNEKLLTIIRRRSYSNFITFIDAMKKTKQSVCIETELTNRACYIRYIPRELIDMILLKSIVGIMSSEWMSAVRDNIETVSGSYNLYATVTNTVWMSVNIRLKSVTSQWKQVKYLKKERVLKKFFLQHLREHYVIFSEQLNCRYVLVDCLEKEGVITEEERRDILEADHRVATRMYKDIPESSWPQMRDSEQMLLSNKILLKYLLEKNYSQISKFMELLEDTCSTHILNYFIRCEGSFGDVWPIKDKDRFNVIKCGTAIMSQMNILALAEERVKNEEQFGTHYKRAGERDSIHPIPEKTPSQAVWQNSLNPIDKHKEVVELKSFDDNTLYHLESTALNHDRQNLIDLLYNEGCISLLQKRHIEQQPTLQQRHLEMLQLIKNGSIRTFKVALEYFRITNQDKVFDMLNRKYCSEEIQMSDWFDSSNDTPVFGVTRLDNEIYVISQSSNIVQVYQDDKSNDEPKDDNIEVKGMKNPCDITASKPSQSIYISDSSNRCLWRIQMPGREVQRCDIKGNPYRMSISRDDVLIICIYLDGNKYLNLYSSSDISMINSVLLPTELKELHHAVQLLNKNFIVSHSMKNDPDFFLISEFSIEANNFIQSFDPRVVGFDQLYHWNPFYISIDEDENIFVADRDSDRILQLNSRLTDVQTLLNRLQHSIESPQIVYYVQEKNQLIVGQRRSEESAHGLRVFNLAPHTTITGHRSNESELELIKFGSFQSVEVNVERNDQMPNSMPDMQLIGQFEIKGEANESQVEGVTWFENKIYVICRGSNNMHIFSDETPFVELKPEIKIKEMRNPGDISASKASRSIFISDLNLRCLWKVRMLESEGIKQCRMDGRPLTLSITSSDKLIVLIKRKHRYFLDIYGCMDVNWEHTISLPTEIYKVVSHAVQSSIGNIIISYSTKEFRDVYMISELSIDGKNFSRTLDPRLVEMINVKNWKPNYSSFDGDGNLFVADLDQYKVYWLNSQLTDPQILLKKYQHDLHGPNKLFYIQEKQQLIVGQLGLIGMPGRVSVFDCNP